MAALCPQVVQQLRQEILLRQGCRPPSAAAVDLGLGPVAAAFPHGAFPTGAIHELLSDGPEEAAASGAFSSALIGRLMARGGACIWIGPRRNIFPSGLAAFGVEPDKVIFVDVRKEKEGLWVVEEALKCEGLAAVVAEIREVSFLVSRRFQLAVEQSRVTGFLLRDKPRNRDPIAAVARWRVTPAAGGKNAGGSGVGGWAKAAGEWADDEEAMPGVGFPRWKVDLLRIRGGRPGNWELEWREGKFHFIGQAEAGKADKAGKVDEAVAGTVWEEDARRKTG
jgi:protein ImuA